MKGDPFLTVIVTIDAGGAFVRTGGTSHQGPSQGLHLARNTPTSWIFSGVEYTSGLTRGPTRASVERL